MKNTTLHTIQHLSADDLTNKTELVGFRGDYSSYQDAVESAGLHGSERSIEAFTNFDTDKSGFYDVLQSIRLVEDITGIDDYMVGHVVKTKTHELYLSLDFIDAMLEHFGEDLKLLDVYNLAIEYNKSSNFSDKILGGEALDLNGFHIGYTERTSNRVIECLECMAYETFDGRLALNKSLQFEFIKEVTTDPEGKQINFHEGQYSCHHCGKKTISSRTYL